MKVTKLTDDEVATVKDIQAKNDAIVKEFGLIAIAELNLDARRERAENFLEKLRQAEVDIAKNLEEKYGKGTVNLATGEFNAIESKG